MGSVVDGTMAVMGIIAGLMVVFMSLKASESVHDSSSLKTVDVPVKNKKKAA